MRNMEDIQCLIGVAGALIYSGILIALDAHSLRLVRRTLREDGPRRTLLRLVAAVLAGMMVLQAASGVVTACMLSPLRRWGPLSDFAANPAVDDALHAMFLLVAAAQICTNVLCLGLLQSLAQGEAEPPRQVRLKWEYYLVWVSVIMLLGAAMYWFFCRPGA